MATGGTLPFKKEQTISLYNTTGVIERDKNIYYSPFIKQSASKIKEVWLTKFKTLCSSPIDYTDISISVWSPQDRTLKVKGNVDDFRLVTEHGLALNYLVLTRKVYDSENVYKKYYYAFFITNVSQTGQGSVVLTVEPDHFTNVFYLHNEEAFSGEGYYDAFNGKMKNCYIERQHYNRVKVESVSVEKTDYVLIREQDGCVVAWDEYEQGSYNVTFDIPKAYFPEDFDYERPFTISIEHLYVRDVEISGFFSVLGETVLNNSVEVNIDTGSGAQLPDDIDWYTDDFGYIEFKIKYWADDYEIKEDNLPIFSQIEQTFKYKRQIRDYKEYLNYGNPLTKEERNIIESTNNFNELSSELKKKCYELCLTYVNIVLSDSKVCIGIKDGDDYHRDRSKYLGEDYPLTICSCCLIDVPDFLEKYRSSMNFSIPLYVKITGVNILVPIKSYNGEESYQVNLSSFSNLSYMLDTFSSINEYIVGVFISKEYLDENRYVKCTDSGYQCIYSESSISNLARTSQKCFLPVFAEDTGDTIQDIIENKISYYLSSVINAGETYPIRYDLLNFKNGVLQEDDVDFCGKPFLINNILTRKINITLLNNLADNLKDVYFDPVLFFPPYSFYSLSYLGATEVILDRKNYYENNNINIYLTLDFEATLKYYVLPEYTIMGEKRKMYSECLTVTSTASLLYKTEALETYLISNRAQMKNQYAVIEERYAYTQTEGLVAGGEKMLTGAIKGYASAGKAGGVAGLVSGAISTLSTAYQNALDRDMSLSITEMNQKAKMSDLGNQPSSVKQLGTSAIVDMATKECGVFINHYSIDEVSYNSICKYLERFGYLVNLYDLLNVNTRVGWDYVQVITFDYEAVINIEQEESIRQIFAEGVTLLHDKSVMTNGHNYELILKEVI